MLITIAHQKGGVGKSTIAWLLYGELSKQIEDKKLKGYEKIYFIDFDIQKTISKISEIRKNKHDEGINLLAVNTLQQFKNIYKKTALLKQQKKDNSIIVVDLGGFDSEENRIIISASDIVITPVSDKGFELLGLKNFEQILMSISKAKKSQKKVKVVFNKISHSKKDIKSVESFVKKSKHFDLLQSVLKDRKVYDTIPTMGRFFHELTQQELNNTSVLNGKKEIDNFTKEIIKEIRECL